MRVQFVRSVNTVDMTAEEICEKYLFSDFFHFATPEEKATVMLAIAREANEMQRKEMGDKGLPSVE